MLMFSGNAEWLSCDKCQKETPHAEENEMIESAGWINFSANVHYCKKCSKILPEIGQIWRHKYDELVTIAALGHHGVQRLPCVFVRDGLGDWENFLIPSFLRNYKFETIHRKK